MGRVAWHATVRQDNPVSRTDTLVQSHRILMVGLDAGALTFFESIARLPQTLVLAKPARQACLRWVADLRFKAAARGSHGSRRAAGVDGTATSSRDADNSWLSNVCYALSCS